MTIAQLKMRVSPMVEMLRVKTFLSTLCKVFQNEILAAEGAAKTLRSEVEKIAPGRHEQLTYI